MAVFSSVRMCMKSMISFTGSSYRNMSNSICDVSLGSSRMHHFHICVGQKNTYAPLKSSGSSCTSTVRLQASRWSCLGSNNVKQIDGNQSLRLNCIRGTRFSRKTCLDIAFKSHSMNLRLFMPNKGKITKSKYNMQSGSWNRCYGLVALLIGSLVCCASSEPSNAESPDAKNIKEDSSSSSPDAKNIKEDSSSSSPDAKNIKEDSPSSSPAFFSHGKKVHTDYSVIGIPGDGRCLFRSVAHGACSRSGKPIPDENLQRKLADELRDQVADEFIKRREETEWFIEGDFDTYVRKIRKPHVWGGEPELLMASHVLQMPITVYMHDRDSGGLISIAEYGQEYGKDNPIEVLYHGFGHYDALQIPRQKGARSRL